MKLALLVFGLLVIGVLCVFAFVVLDVWPDDHQGYAMLLVTVLCGSGALLGTWVAFGRKSIVWRVVGIIVAITVCVTLSSMAEPRLGFDLWTIPVVAPMVVTALPLLIARATGVELQEVGQNPSMIRPSELAGRRESDVVYDEAAGSRIQWSLWSLLSWTAAIAVLLSCLSTWRIVVSADVIDEFVSWQWVSDSAAFAFLPPAVVWAALGTRWFAARIALLTLSIVLTAIALAGFMGSDLGVLGVVVLIPTLWLTGSFLVVRLAGYRLVWRRSIML